jgi:hypothetical protein
MELKRGQWVEVKKRCKSDYNGCYGKLSKIVGDNAIVILPHVDSVIESVPCKNYDGYACDGAVLTFSLKQLKPYSR